MTPEATFGVRLQTPGRPSARPAEPRLDAMNTSHTGRPVTVPPAPAPSDATVSGRPFAFLPTVPAGPESLTYFQLSRRTRGWWRPLATLGVFVGVMLGLFVGLFLVLGLILGFDSLANNPVNMTDPAGAALGAGILALFVPASMITVRLMGRGGTIHSVAGRLRWGLFGSSLALAIVPVVASIVVTWPFDPVAPSVSATTVGMLAVALLIVPLQAAGEEYLFRGILMQAVGHWLRAPIWGLIVSLPLFVLGHDYDAWGLAFTGVFAAVATWLTWRTGGLEAAIALHVVNNVAVFLLAAFGMADLAATEITWAGGITAVAIPIGFALLFAWWWKRTDGDTRYARTVPAVAPLDVPVLTASVVADPVVAGHAHTDADLAALALAALALAETDLAPDTLRTGVRVRS